MDIKSEAQKILEREFSGKTPITYDTDEIPSVETLVENDVPTQETVEAFISLREFMKTQMN